VADAGRRRRLNEHRLARLLIGLVEAGAELGVEAPGPVVVTLGRAASTTRSPRSARPSFARIAEVSRKAGTGLPSFSRARLKVRHRMSSDRSAAALTSHREVSHVHGQPGSK